jgi:hypothetical protein
MGAVDGVRKRRTERSPPLPLALARPLALASFTRRHAPEPATEPEPARTREPT